MRQILLYLIVVLFSLGVSAQQTDRDYVRRGNSMYGDSLFVKAEEFYLKALDKNHGSSNAAYNLGNVYLEQKKDKDAAGQYKNAIANLESEKNRLAEAGKKKDSDYSAVKEQTAMAYHNLGVILQASQNYEDAISAYQQALRNNPHDNETRYNLALAMSQLKQQQQDKQNQEQNQQNKQNQEQDKQNQERQNDEQNRQQQNDQRQDMSQENAEQLLQAALQDEKEVQEKIRKMMRIQQQKQLDKDW